MKKQTKNTLKVLSTLALAGTVTLASGTNVDAKTYKPEVRYDNGKYFVKTSDPSAKGKILEFSINQNSNEHPYFIYDIVSDYNNQEVEINKNNVETTTNINLNDGRLISIQDNEKPYPDQETTEKAEYEKQLKDFYKETASGAVSIKDALGGKQGAPAEGKVETPQPTKPVETPVKPKEEKKETTTQTETPKTTQTPTTPEKKVTDKKETPTPKTTQTQEQTKDNKQVTEKKETTAKPLPKTTAETFGGLALYTFGGLSLLSILVFFGLRKKQK